MATSPIGHTASDGASLHSMLSLQSLRSLQTEQVQALRSLGIYLAGDLLHYAPIHRAEMLMAVAERRIAHDVDLHDLLDGDTEEIGQDQLPNLPIRALQGIGESAAKTLKDAFGVTTIRELAAFAPYREAQRFLLAASSVFREPQSAPDELIPDVIGAVHSVANFSSFVREDGIRFHDTVLVFDKARQPQVDQRLATVFPVSRNALGVGDPPVELGLGYLAKLTQRWVNLGTHLGDVVYSLALAPGESRNIAIVEWRRQQQTRRTEDTKATEVLTSRLYHSRALEEVVEAVAREHQWGGTDTAAGTVAASGAGVMSAALAGGMAGAVPGSVIGAVVGGIAGSEAPVLGNVAGALVGAGAGAVIGFGIGATIAGSASLVGAANAQIGTLHTDSSGRRRILSDLSQEITEMTSQKSSLVRSLWSDIFVTDEQVEGENVTTHNVTNYNHSHALTVQYYEILQHYKTQMGLGGAEPLLFLPFRPLDFDINLVQDYWEILRPHVTSADVVGLMERYIESKGMVLAEDVAWHLKSVDVRIWPHKNWMQYVPEKIDFVGAEEGAYPGTLEVELGHAHYELDSDSGSPHQLTGLQLSGHGRPAVGPLDCTAEGRFRVRAEFDVVGLADNRMTLLTREWIVKADARGRLMLDFDLGQTKPEDITDVSVATIERHFQAHSYRFTRVLLLSLERERLTDLVSSLFFQPKLDMAEFGASKAIAEEHPIDKAFVSPERSPEEVFVATAPDVVIRAIYAHTGRADLLRALAAQREDVDAVMRSLVTKLGDTPITDRSSREPIASAVTASVTSWGKLAAEAQQNAVSSIKKQLEALVDALAAQKDKLGRWLYFSDVVHPEPLAIASNALVFRMKTGDLAKHQSAAYAAEDPHIKKLLDYPDAVAAMVEEWPTPKAGRAQAADDIYLPTSGVFAEAILGRSNASEKIDVSRFYNWQDSPIPHLAPEILPVQLGGRQGEPLGTESEMPAGVLNIVNPASFPDPQGMASALAALQNGALFRDMSGAQQLAQILGNLSSLAGKTAEVAGTMTGNAQREALAAATQMGTQVADLAKALAAQSGRPSSPTDKGGALNVIDKEAEAAALPGGGTGAPQGSGSGGQQSGGTTPPTDPTGKERKSEEKKAVVGVPKVGESTGSTTANDRIEFEISLEDQRGLPMRGWVTLGLKGNFVGYTFGRQSQVYVSDYTPGAMLSLPEFYTTGSDQSITLVFEPGRAVGLLYVSAVVLAHFSEHDEKDFDLCFEGKKNEKIPGSDSQRILRLRMQSMDVTVTAQDIVSAYETIAEETSKGIGVELGVEGRLPAKVKAKIVGKYAQEWKETHESGSSVTTGVSHEYTLKVPTGGLDIFIE